LTESSIDPAADEALLAAFRGWDDDRG
jgi:hypothetical protein